MPPALSPSAQATELVSKVSDFPHVTIDSRSVKHGSLFAAIRGDRFDGHSFLDAAVEKGAGAVLVERHMLPPDFRTRHPKVTVVEVDKVEEALRTLATSRRKSYSNLLLVIAGSVGKTTTKELLVALFRAHARAKNQAESAVVATKGSENGFLGIPLTLLTINASTKYAFIEVGIDDIGAMKKHMELVKPTHSLLTAVGPEHLEKLIDLETVLKEEWLALSMPYAHGATIYLQECDPLIAREAGSIADLKRKVSLGTEPGASYTLTLLADGDFKIDGQTFRSPLPGRHNVENVALAVVVALHQGISYETILRALGEFSPAFGRSDVKRWGKSTLLCDYYNANPTSVRAALETFSALKVESSPDASAAPRKFVALGDMLELGSEEERYHRELAPALRDGKYAGVFLYGPKMRWLENELRAQGDAAPAIIEWKATHAELADAIKGHFRDGDALLLKGSRGMKMEEVYAALTGSPA